MRLFEEAPAQRGLFSCRLFTRRKHEGSAATPGEPAHRFHRERLVLPTQIHKGRLYARVTHQFLERDELIRVCLIKLHRKCRAERVHGRPDTNSGSTFFTVSQMTLSDRSGRFTAPGLRFGMRYSSLPFQTPASPAALRMSTYSSGSGFTMIFPPFSANRIVPRPKSTSLSRTCANAFRRAPR